ncbi:hypothetical protein ACFQGT_00405 [Natrialbaceae archaeon GCM10025810]
MYRRTFLARAGAVTISSVALTSPASAQSVPDRPDHLENVDDDTDELEQYQPSFIASSTTRSEIEGVYGWYADSSEYDGRAYYYWVRYPTQRGILPSWVPVVGSADSHFRDHEPVVVYTDDAGDVERVIVSGYHHFVLDLDSDSLELREDRADDPTHAKLRIVDHHHHYRNGADSTRDGVLPDTMAGVDLRGWLDERESWYDLGVFESSNPEAIEDPFALRDDLDTWWADGSADAWVGRNVWVPLGLRGADETDTLRIEEE